MSFLLGTTNLDTGVESYGWQRFATTWGTCRSLTLQRRDCSQKDEHTRV